MAERERALAYELSKCITCGNCLEVCPQVNERSNFMGAARLLLRSNGANAGPLAAQNLEHAEVQIARAGAICRQLVERLK